MVDDRSDRVPFRHEAGDLGDDADAGDFAGAAPADRRRAPRLAITRRCKVFDPRARRYVAAETRDLSAGGMCVRLDGPLPIEPGDRLYIGLSALGPSELLRQAEMHGSRVMWVDAATDGRAVLGLEVDDADADAGETAFVPRLAA